jgi:hypothetical protein
VEILECRNFGVWFATMEFLTVFTLAIHRFSCISILYFYLLKVDIIEKLN